MKEPSNPGPFPEIEGGAVDEIAFFGTELRLMPVATPMSESWRSLLLDFARRTLLRVRGV